MQPSISRETIVDRRQPVIRWGAVFAGALVSVGLWVLLLTLGTGIGLAAINPNDEHSLRAVGLGTTIWSLIAPLIAMFFGGLIAGRFATTFSRRIGALHGLVVWALAAVVGVLATMSVVSAIVGGAMTVTKAVGPSVHIDRQTLMDESTSAKTPSTEQTPNQLQQRQEAVPEDAREQAKRAALVAADATGKALFFVGLSLLVSLVTAMLGGLAGVRRRATEEERVVRTTVPPPPPPTAAAIVTEP